MRVIVDSALSFARRVGTGDAVKIALTVADTLGRRVIVDSALSFARRAGTDDAVKIALTVADTLGRRVIVEMAEINAAALLGVDCPEKVEI